MDLAKRISGQTDNLNKIINISQSIKDETSLFELSKSGAQLLRLVDPFLESIVPKEVKYIEIIKVLDNKNCKFLVE